MALRCRYINAVQSRTMWPITFNGMLFNANRANNSGTGECIDARTWGEMAFWQNTRLPYHSMVRAGDADRLETIFRYYNNMVPCRIVILSRFVVLPVSLTLKVSLSRWQHNSRRGERALSHVCGGNG